MIDVKKLLGKRIQELRKGMKLSQEVMAETVGIEPNNLSRIENGKNYPTPDNLARIAEALGVTPEKLYRFSHHKDYSEIKLEIISALNDEKFGRLLHKFYTTLKE